MGRFSDNLCRVASTREDKRRSKDEIAERFLRHIREQTANPPRPAPDDLARRYPEAAREVEGTADAQ